MKHKAMSVVLSIAVALLSLFSYAVAVELPASETQFELTIKNHQFDKTELKAPAGKPIIIVLKNEDKTPEEFDSHDLRVEKVVGGGGTVTIKIKPLSQGSYHFRGEYHEKTAKGIVVVE